ncbi:ABC transporter permease [Arthrobacter sp. D1-29]
MLQVALSQFRVHSRRFIAVGLAVMLSVAFLATTLMVSASTQASLEASLGEAYSRAGIIATPAGQAFDEAALKAVAATPGIKEVYGQQSAATVFGVRGEQVFGRVRNLAPAGLEPSSMESGTVPAHPGEVALDATTAARYGLSAGDSLTIASSDGGTSVTMTVSGVMGSSNDPFAAAVPQLLALAPAVSALAGQGTGSSLAGGYESIQVALAPGTDGAKAKQDLAAALSESGAGNAYLRTSTEQVTSQVALMTGGRDELTIVLLAFAGVALVVSGLVVSNTFPVLVAQRTRELALLRCLGAGRSQVRNSVLAEALVVGLASSVLGVLAGTGLMAALIGWARTQPDMTFTTLAVPPSALAAGLAVGTLLTVIAALVPARAATAVAPLAALRPSDDASIGNAKGRLRLVLGLLALVAGVPLLVVGALGVQLVIAFAGGMISFIGVLLCSTLFIPRLVALFGKLAAPAGVPGRLAAVNALRNPARTSVTAAALLIGVTLVALMMTGASTARLAFDDALAQNYPVDMGVMAGTPGGSGALGVSAKADVTGVPEVPGLAQESVLTKEQRQAVLQIGGVSAAVLVPISGHVDLAGVNTPVFALTAAEAREVLRDDALRLEPGKIYLPEGSASGAATVSGNAGVRELDAVVLKTRNMPPLVSSETAQSLGVPAEGAALWVRLADGPRGAQLSADQIHDIQRSIADVLDVGESAVSGAAIERVAFNDVIDVLLLVVTGLLGVAVLIALIGVANTLSLSVLERTQENSLLRALGLTRGQLRGMLALEAVLVAGVAALLGAALGSIYGWLGAKSALGSLAEVTPSIPWLQLLGVLAVAILAGLLASVVPARRAARLSPVEGLATS